MIRATLYLVLVPNKLLISKGKDYCKLKRLSVMHGFKGVPLPLRRWVCTTAHYGTSARHLCSKYVCTEAVHKYSKQQLRGAAAFERAFTHVLLLLHMSWIHCSTSALAPLRVLLCQPCRC